MEHLIANPASAFSWLLNLLSLTAAYCLSNHKVKVGRFVAAIAALGWIGYGVLIDEMSFIVANCVFAYIYISAIRKFSSKQDDYKTENSELKAKNQALMEEVAQAQVMAEANLNKLIIEAEDHLAHLKGMKERYALEQPEEAAVKAA